MVVPETEVFVLGPDGTELLRTVLTPGEYLIGRTEECDLRVEADLVSRRHAKLIIKDDGVLVEDLGSSNGTYVNGQAVTDSARLWPNQRIQVGAATISIRRKRLPGESEPPPSAAAVRRLLPDELLRDRKYEIGREVAKGGMGAILSANEGAIRREVAMKVMLHRAGEDDLLRFVEEAQITGQLEHPNIVPVHELGVDENDQLYYTMKMVRGITLKKVLELLAQGIPETISKYPLPVLLTIFQKVCDGLAFAHAKGVLHRDLKPENLMLGGYGEVLIMDWGLAKIIDAGPKADATIAVVKSVVFSARKDEQLGATMVGTIMGTPQFMSPEQARGEVETLGVASDLYSLGAILYQILALRPSVTGKTAMEIVDRVGRGEILPLPTGRGPGDKARSLPHLPGGVVPDSLAAVARKAMAFDPGKRYANVHDLQADITAYQGGYATSAEHATAWKQFQLLIQRNRRAAIIAAAALAFIAVLSVFFVTNVVHERNRAEAQKSRAIAGEKRAEQALTVANSALLRVKIEKAREALENDNASNGLAWLAAVLRQDEGNRFAGSWILSALSDRNFALPSAPKIVPPERRAVTNPQNSVTFSPDGTQLLVGSRAHSLGVWDVATGQLLREIGPVGDVRAVRWAIDGRRVAMTTYGSRELTLWDAQTGKLLAKSASAENSLTHGMVFSPDGNLVAACDERGGTRVYDGRTLSQIGGLFQVGTNASALAFSPDNRWLAIRGSSPQEMQVFEIATGKAVMPAVPDSNGWPAFHSTEPLLFVPAYTRQGRWRIMDLVKGTFVEAREAMGGGGDGVFSPNEQRVATALGDGRARIWDARTGEPLTPILRHGGAVGRPQFSPEGLRLFAASGDYRLRLWDARSGELLAEPWQFSGGAIDIGQCRLSPDGTRAAVAGRNQRLVELFDVREGRRLPLMFKDSGGISAIAFSPDGRRLVYSSQSDRSPHVAMLDLLTGKNAVPDLVHAESVYFVVYSPDGRTLASACNDGTARVWDAETGEPLTAPLPMGTGLRSIAFSPDGRLLAGTGNERAVRIVDISTGKSVGQPLPLSSPGNQVVFSPDGESLAASCWGGAVLFDAKTGKRRKVVAGGSNATDLCFSTDGRRLAVGTETDGVHVVDLPGGEELYEALPHANRVAAVRFSRDSRRLLTASYDGIARIWDAETGRPLSPPLRHAEQIRAAEFSPDGARVVTGSRDGVVRLWDAATGQPLTEPLRHPREIRTLAFSPDGRRLAVGLSSDNIMIWETPPLPAAIPAWLPQLAESVAGQRVDDRGELSSDGVPDFWLLRQQILASPGSDDYTAWARWFFDDRLTRAASPWTAEKLTDQLPKIRSFGDGWARELILRYQPDNFWVMAELGRRLAADKATQRDGEYLLSMASVTRVNALLRAQRAAGNESYTTGVGVRGFPGRDPAAGAQQIDLTGHYNAILDDAWFSDHSAALADLPKGLQTFGGIRFDIRGVIALAGKRYGSLPSAVEGIQVPARPRRLHVLHACGWSAPDGTKIGAYIIRYADGEKRELPVVYGEDLRNWNQQTDPKPIHTHASLAWKRESGTPSAQLFLRSYDNPRPDVDVTSIDIVSAQAEPAPFVVAITAE